MIRILIVDDQPLMRAGLKYLLMGEGDMVVDGEADCGVDALNQVRTGAWDLIILDVSLPDIPGLDVLKQIKIEKPRLPVLILSVHAEEQIGIRALRAGALGYVAKESMPEELITAVRKVAAQRKYISPALAETLAFSLDAPGDRPFHESLSDREFQVLQSLAAGRTVTEIAQDLTLSPKTISTYRARIIRKTHLKNNVEIARYGIQHNLVE